MKRSRKGRTRDPFERRYLAGTRAALRWLRSPASERGVSSAFEAVFLLAGPMVKREFERFAAHPAGARLLQERPNLLETLADTEALAAMPEGSFGRAYYEFMERANVSDVRSFAALARVDEICARLGWSDDVAWFIERMSHSHDLFHVLSGYGSDLAGEGAVIYFTYGQFPLPVLWGILAVLGALRPRIGWRRWNRYLRGAYARGCAAGPLTCVDYEREFHEPLETVRRRHGIIPIEQAHRREGLVVDYMSVPAGLGLT